MRADIEVY